MSLPRLALPGLRATLSSVLQPRAALAQVAEDSARVAAVSTLIAEDEMRIASVITGKWHVAGNIVIHGGGDTATAVYFLIVLERLTGLTLAGTAVITDTFQRVERGWQVMRHRTRMDPATLEAMQQ